MKNCCSYESGLVMGPLFMSGVTVKVMPGVGETEGAGVGEAVGGCVGAGVGDRLGACDGATVGSALGSGTGAVVGEKVGACENVGAAVGEDVAVSAPSTVALARALEESASATIVAASVPLVAAVLIAEDTLAIGSSPLAFAEVTKATAVVIDAPVVSRRRFVTLAEQLVTVIMLSSVPKSDSTEASAEMSAFSSAMPT